MVMEFRYSEVCVGLVASEKKGYDIAVRSVSYLE